MRPKTGLVLASAISVLVLTGLYSQTYHRTQAAPQKPVKHKTIHIDGGLGAPATLEELWRITPLIVRAEVHRGRPFDLTLPGPDQPRDVFVRTAYTFAVNELFKNATGEEREVTEVEVVQLGGDRDRGTVIESVTDPTFPRFRQGEQYVLFLKPSPKKDGTYVMATDTPDSAFLLAADATVIPRGRSSLAQSLSKYNREDFLNLLRGFAEAGR